MMHFSTVCNSLKHSVADWDFQTARWKLDDTRFYTPPSSLTTTQHIENTVLSRLADARNLAEGRLVWRCYNVGEFAMLVTFRNQASLGSADRDNCYWLYAPDLAHVRLYACLAGVQRLIGPWDVLWERNVWEHWRLGWWDGFDEHNDPALAAELEHQEAGEWISAGILYDPINLFKLSAINRPGVFIEQFNFWHDETEIWIPL